MKIFLIVVLLVFSMSVLAKSFRCENVDDHKMVMELTSNAWDSESVGGKVSIKFSYSNRIFATDYNAGLADSPFVIGGRIKLPDNMSSVPIMVLLSKDFSKATVKLSAEDEVLDYGRFTCSEI